MQVALTEFDGRPRDFRSRSRRRTNNGGFRPPGSCPIPRVSPRSPIWRPAGLRLARKPAAEPRRLALVMSDYPCARRSSRLRRRARYAGKRDVRSSGICWRERDMRLALGYLIFPFSSTGSVTPSGICPESLSERGSGVDPWIGAAVRGLSRDDTVGTQGRARGRPGLTGRRDPVPDGHVASQHAGSPLDPCQRGRGSAVSGHVAPLTRPSLPRGPPSPAEGEGRPSRHRAKSRSSSTRPRPVGRPQGRLSRPRRAAGPRLPRLLPRAAPGRRRPDPSGHPRHDGMAAGQGGGPFRRMLAAARGRRPAGDLPLRRRRSRRGGPAQATARPVTLGHLPPA